MRFDVHKAIGGTMITTQGDVVIASFSKDEAGDIAFAAVKHGLVNTDHTLFDADTGKFIVADVGQLAD